MGNRAVITTPSKEIGVYLHWNGGRDSVEAFLTYCNLKGYRSPEGDCYGWARLCQVIGNFFGGDTSIGIDLYDRLDTDNWDNGVYIIKGWEIVGREFNRNGEQNVYKLDQMLMEIDKAQPESERIGDYIAAPMVPIKSLKVGDMVYQEYGGGYKAFEVVGFGDGDYVNGSIREGVPYVNKYGNCVLGFKSNPNNYVSSTCGCPEGYVRIKVAE